MATRKKGLGRGLDALLGADTGALDQMGRQSPEQLPNVLDVRVLRAGRYQPRTRMDEGALNDLADSIRTQGIMQPILVRALDGKDKGHYEIIAGERRFRA
ncbi:MAG TPA: ParB/RepB/Spo0J family partition protein, partial [Castellaniella sp.]|nr:ParB/RepB/Spo0J family partition protein [Castellaniella sp.]